MATERALDDMAGSTTETPLVSIRLPQSWCIASTDAIIRVAELAEELGFWGVSVQDHLLSNSDVSPCGQLHDEDRAVFESLQTLAFVAGRTTTLRLVTAIVVLSFRSPVLLAKELATLDVLSRGRLVAGVGIGASPKVDSDQRQTLVAHRDIASREFELLGVAGHRGRLADEYIDAVRMLWEEDAPSYHGDFVSFDGVDLYPKPLQQPHPPLWVGGRSVAAQRRVAAHADGWFPSQETVDGYANGRATILDLASEAGRAAPAGWGVNLFMAVGSNDDTARETMRAGLGHRFAGDDALFTSTIAGSPETVARRMQEYMAAGVRVFDLKLLPLTLEETLRQMHVLANDVVPLMS